MQNESNRWGAYWFEPGFLVAAAAVCTMVSGALVATCWPGAGARTTPGLEIVDEGAHALTPGECRSTLGAVLTEFRSDPRVLWVWVEQSVPGASRRAPFTEDTSVSRAAPRPYAFRPGTPVSAEELCAHPLNSVHALSLGGVTRPVLEPDLPPWSMTAAP